MIRIIISFIFLLLSLLTIFPVPSRYVWYLGIAVGEFPWIWIIAMILMLLWNGRSGRYRRVSLSLNIVSLLLFCLPLFQAFSIGRNLDERLRKAFGVISQPIGPHRARAFSLSQMVSGIGASHLPFTTMQYAIHTGVPLTLNLYRTPLPGIRPCLLVVHGGSWKSGSNAELPDVNSYFAKAGYQVASINYRLAPEYKSPAPQEDVKAAIAYLKTQGAALGIDTTAFVLMGRSAGGQIVLTAAYSLHDPAIRGVISFYGPTDMYWAYSHPDNPLVMHSRNVMEDFFGGSPSQVPQAYTEGSPTRFVNAQTVPTLLVHGGNDAHVHYDEAVLLKKYLDSAGVPNVLLGLPWATHGCEYSLNGPSGQLAVYAEERFLGAVTMKR